MPGQSSQPAFVSSNGSDQWTLNNNLNIVENEMILEWNQWGTVPSVSNVNYISNGVNGVQHGTPQNHVGYMNILYETHAINIQTVSPQNAQSLPAALAMVHAPQRGPTLGVWSAPQNTNLIQTAWNETSRSGAKKLKRIRTAFTTDRIMELEQEYARTKYLDRNRRLELAATLRLNKRTIKIWFQNRRMKGKMERAESLEEVEDMQPSMTQPPSGLDVSMLVPERYQPNGAYNGMNMFAEQYPASSSTMPMAPIPQPQIIYPNPGYYAPYAIQEDSTLQYQQAHLQMQQYSEVQSESSAALTTASLGGLSTEVENPPISAIDITSDWSWL